MISKQNTKMNTNNAWRFMEMVQSFEEIIAVYDYSDKWLSDQEKLGRASPYNDQKVFGVEWDALASYECDSTLGSCLSPQSLA
jgi:hypothetical protein